MKKFFASIMAIVLCLSLSLCAFAEEFTIRNEITIGDDYETVKSKETLPVTSEADDKAYFCVKGTVSGIDDVAVQYNFDEEGKLYKIQYTYPSTTYKDFSDDEYEKINSGLIRKYGEPLGYSNGSCYIFESGTLSGAYLMVGLMEYSDGVGDLRDYDEWVVDYTDYHIKIEEVQFYYGKSYSDLSYHHDLSYTKFTDADIEQAQEDKANRNSEVDDDL